MDGTLAFRLATPRDEAALRAFLAAAALPTDDVWVGSHEYVLAVAGGELVGSAGVEPCGDDALLRSLAVAPARRRQGLGAALFERAAARAILRGARTAYALTTTAERFCLAHGFDRVPRAEVPAGIAATPQFRSLCPKSAAVFRRRLTDAPAHFPADVLRLRPDVPGAAMWGVALDGAMLTYYELQPATRFELHRHDAEQITMVLEGALYFGLEGGREVRVGAGEVIAVPGGAPHAVWTGEQPTRAVDAWAPPRRELVR
jgi:N-acetylglutamate synthase-like GNAT family acetyltransferase